MAESVYFAAWYSGKQYYIYLSYRSAVSVLGNKFELADCVKRQLYLFSSHQSPALDNMTASAWFMCTAIKIAA